MASFRDQAEARSPWSLDPDSRFGFAQSVNNNQPQMALYYVQAILKEMDATIAELRAEVAELKATPKASTASRAKKDDAAE